MKRALLLSGEREGDETVFVYTMEEVEYLLFCVREAHRGFPSAPGTMGRVIEGALARAAGEMQVAFRTDGSK